MPALSARPGLGGESESGGNRDDLRRSMWFDGAIGLVVAAALLAGLARPGFPLLRDMVATPRPALTDAALGLEEAAARAVPQDLVMVVAARVVTALGLPSWPILGLLTLGFCLWIALATGALVRLFMSENGRGVAGRWASAPAVVLALWNPFVVERLLQGHWSLLAGLAGVLTLVVALARPQPKWGVAAAALAGASLTPTGWLLGVLAGSASAMAAWRSWGHGGRESERSVLRPGGVALAVAGVLLAAAPWLLATILGGGNWVGESGAPSGGTGVAEFAARAEPAIGTVGSLLALGGIWNSAAVPPSRTTWWAAVALVLWLGLLVSAVPGLWRARHSPVVRASCGLGAGALLLVSLAATPYGLEALDAAVRMVPGAGLLRDSQKFMALAVPVTILAAGERLSVTRGGKTLTGAAVVVVAVMSVPDAPMALWRQLNPVSYGSGWEQVSQIARDGDLLVLPAGSFRSTSLWNNSLPVLDPAPRLLSTRVLTSGDLTVGTAAGSSMLSGEGSRAREASAALLAGAPAAELAQQGVRWVLDENTSEGPRGQAARTLATATERYRDQELVLYEIPGNIAEYPRADPAARMAVLAAHAAWAALLAGGLITAVRTHRRAQGRGRHR